MPADFETVEDRSFVISNFRLQNGAVMPQAKIAYETYGRLAADGRNAMLITHGYTSSHHAAGRNPANGNLPGWWDGLIGSGKPIDTDRLFVVSSNMLGSSFGSSNGAGIAPQTGKPYGLDFPAITVRDIVAAEKALLSALGVRHLIAVPAHPMAATRPSSGQSITLCLWMASFRWSPRPRRRMSSRA